MLVLLTSGYSAPPQCSDTCQSSAQSFLSVLGYPYLFSGRGAVSESLVTFSLKAKPQQYSDVNGILAVV